MKTLTLFFVLLAHTTVLTTANDILSEEEVSCGEGETMFEDSCFWSEGGHPYSWAEAEEVCRSRGMQMASVHSPKEQKIVFDLTGNYNCWIGLTDIEREGDFRWSDDSPVDYLNWGTGNPNGGDAENCVRTFGSDGEWYDDSCDDHWGVVCRGAPSYGGQLRSAGH